ncbi:hypothetical protein BDW69DRAFT_153962 [Aspergillus filifer]
MRSSCLDPQANQKELSLTTVYSILTYASKKSPYILTQQDEHFNSHRICSTSVLQTTSGCF